MDENFEEVFDLLDPGLGKVESVLALSGGEAYQSCCTDFYVLCKPLRIVKNALLFDLVCGLKVGGNLRLRVNLSKQGVKFLLVYNNLLSRLISLARISLRKCLSATQNNMCYSLLYMMKIWLDTLRTQTRFMRDIVKIIAILKDASIPVVSIEDYALKFYKSGRKPDVGRKSLD